MGLQIHCFIKQLLLLAQRIFLLLWLRHLVHHIKRKHVLKLATKSASVLMKCEETVLHVHLSISEVHYRVECVCVCYLAFLSNIPRCKKTVAHEVLRAPWWLSRLSSYVPVMSWFHVWSVTFVSCQLPAPVFYITQP